LISARSRLTVPFGDRRLVFASSPKLTPPAAIGALVDELFGEHDARDQWRILAAISMEFDLKFDDVGHSVLLVSDDREND